MAGNENWEFLIDDIQIYIRSLLSYASQVRLGATCKAERLIMGRQLLKKAHHKEVASQYFAHGLLKKRRLHKQPSHQTPMKYVWDGVKPLFHENPSTFTVEVIGKEDILISKRKHMRNYHRSLAADGEVATLSQIIKGYKYVRRLNEPSFTPIDFIYGATKADNWKLILWICNTLVHTLEFEFSHSTLMQLTGSDDMKELANNPSMMGRAFEVSYTEWPINLYRAVQNFKHQQTCMIKQPHDGLINGCIHDLAPVLHRVLSKGIGVIFGVLNRCVNDQGVYYSFSIIENEFRNRMFRSGDFGKQGRGIMRYAIKHGSIGVLRELLASGLPVGGMAEVCLEERQLSALRIVLPREALFFNTEVVLKKMMDTDNTAIIDCVWHHFTHNLTESRVDMDSVIADWYARKTMLLYCLDHDKLVSFNWWCLKFASTVEAFEDKLTTYCYERLLHISPEFYVLWMKHRLPLPSLQIRYEVVTTRWLFLGMSLEQAQSWLYEHLNMFSTMEHKAMLESYILVLKRIFIPGFDYYRTTPSHACVTFESELRQYAADHGIFLSDNVLAILKNIYSKDY